MTEQSLETPNRSDTLVVLLHAYTSSSQALAAVRDTVQGQWPNAKYLCPDLPASLWSTASPNQIVADLLKMVDIEVESAECTERPIDNIVLIGHSLGALLARKLYVVACGETRAAPFEPQFIDIGSKTADGLLICRPWARLVSRLILLAGMNRGWRITHHLSLTKAPLWAFGAAIGHIIRLISGRTLIISTIRQGAEFVTQLRIQWIRMRQMQERRGSNAAGGAMTIQLLGSIDDMVAPEDNIDLVSGGDFYYMDVPFSGHADIIEFHHPILGAERRRVFLFALLGSEQQLKLDSVVPSDEQFVGANIDITKVLFVIHGIRDAGYWTHKIARRVKKRAGSAAKDWATETSSYGYFPMLPFLFPWYRRKKVEWLMDQYTEAVAKYPDANFYYVGHSNGTYLLAKALELYPCCQFQNIAFAGSVVSRNYDWSRLLEDSPPRVNSVLNFVASKDWVVAFFPKFFQVLGLQDLGSAGHDGFAVVRSGLNVYEVGYVSGGHGAALDEKLWDAIADFIIVGTPSKNQISNVVKRQAWPVKLLGRFPPVVWLIIAVILWGVWIGIVKCIGIAFPEALDRSFATGIGASAYALLIWLAVTRI